DGDVVTFHHDASGRVAGSESTTSGPLLAQSYANASGLPVHEILGSGEVHRRTCYEDGPTGDVLAAAAAGGPALELECRHPYEARDAVLDVVYTRSPGGRIEARTTRFDRPGSGQEVHDDIYTYDEVHQLTSSTHDGVPASYGHDAIGNLTLMEGEAQTYGEAGRPVGGAGPNAILTGAGGRQFTYDA